MTNKTAHRRNRKQLTHHLMMMPGMFFLLLFSYIPMVGIVMAFQDFIPAKGIMGSELVGLKHFRYMFQLPDIFKIIRNTLVISIGKILLGTFMAIAFSILLNEIRKKFLKKTVQTIVYLPHFLSWVVLASVVVNMFNLDGSVNQIVTQLGFDKINFLGNSKIFPGLIIGTDVWKEFGYSSVIYLAAITAIDPGLHEAASIDGASWWKRIWNVTLPGMMPIILLMAAMSLTSILSAGFDQIYNLYTPIVYDTGDVLDTYVYRIGLIGRQYSFGSAVGLLRSIVGMVLLVSANKLTKKLTDQKIF
ncbi:putative aldouronate transport system permease protein [Anaerosporobacter mobilis DSM 15930]|uniref:Putative aldouronate transport system permease protein n=1 Tax=Anaerosporobacter mobilis DSM 15930 TaxID=1120996 RepID=A0A1M7JJR7_9FIRM|nr:ABC transporter permease subunit [Anaerosporobacter mobilis]SHM53244.1 putative aldouronate transport system permease protein [Anaerosporobacter mobilis DSM 15930]